MAKVRGGDDYRGGGDDYIGGIIDEVAQAGLWTPTPQSHWIEGVGYDITTGRLTVRFKPSGVEKHWTEPVDTYYSLANADSTGTEFWALGLYGTED